MCLLHLRRSLRIGTSASGDPFQPSSSVSSSSSREGREGGGAAADAAFIRLVLPYPGAVSLLATYCKAGDPELLQVRKRERARLQHNFKLLATPLPERLGVKIYVVHIYTRANFYLRKEEGMRRSVNVPPMSTSTSVCKPSAPYIVYPPFFPVQLQFFFYPVHGIRYMFSTTPTLTVVPTSTSFCRPKTRNQAQTYISICPHFNFVSQALYTASGRHLEAGQVLLRDAYLQTELPNRLRGLKRAIEAFSAGE